MATMYSLFFGLLFTTLCSDKGNGSGVLRPDVVTPSYVMSTGVETSKDFIETGFNNSLFSRKPQLSFSMTRISFFSLMKKTKQKKSRLGQYDAKYFLAGLNISEPLRFAPLHRYVFNDHQKIFLTLYRPRSFEDEKSRTRTVSQPRPFYRDSASSSLQLGIMSPVKPSLRAHRRYILTIAMGGTNVRSECSSDDFCFFLGKRRSLSGDEDNYKIRNNKTLLAESRQSIIAIASKELGTHEATGNNDGSRVEEYLRYTNLGKGYEWCAAFVSWCYGQAGFAVPRNPWSPALFPKVKLIRKDQCQPADVFGIYGVKVRRINHVGLVKELSKDYLITIEGNSNNRVESRRRHLKTVYAIANWVN